jgi:hypothetical protein
VTFEAKYIPAVIEQMRTLPQPERPIPIWVGGTSEPALKRAVRLDGWHGSRAMPEQAAPLVKRLRAERPGDDFTISLRSGWDGRDAGALRARLEGYAAVGVQHVLVEPAERHLQDWLAAVERIAKAGEGMLA